MAIPDFQSIMRPALVVIQAGGEVPVAGLRDDLAAGFALSDEELDERLPSGRDRTFRNRVGWSLTQLKGAGAVSSPQRGVDRITDRGAQLLRDVPPEDRAA